jgi:hypothetical protein
MSDNVSGGGWVGGDGINRRGGGGGGIRRLVASGGAGGGGGICVRSNGGDDGGGGINCWGGYADDGAGEGGSTLRSRGEGRLLLSDKRNLEGEDIGNVHVLDGEFDSYYATDTRKR